MIIEVNGQQVEVDDKFAKLSPEKQQETLQYITKSMSAQETTEAKQVNPLMATGVGVVGGQILGPMINKGYEAMSSGPQSSGGMGQSSANGASPGQKWSAKTGFGVGPGQTVEEVSSAYKAQNQPIGQGKITSKIPRNSPMNVDKMLELEAAQKAEAARRAQALGQGMPMSERIMSKLPGPVQSAGRFIGGATQSGVAPYVGRSVAGAGVGFQGADMYNRFQQGDIPGAAISGLGALGSVASFVPTPVTRIGGAAVGVGAELLNQYLDSLKKKVEGMGAPAAAPAPIQGPLNASSPVPGMAKGGEVLKQLKKLNLAELEGKTLLGTMSDRTKVGDGLKGGPMFPTIHEGAAWAMDAPGAATRLLKAMHGAGGPDQTVIAPMLMSTGAHRSNRDVSKMAVDQFRQNYEKGGFSPERLAEIEARIRSMPGLAEHPGMMDKGAREIMDKLTFAQRKQIVDALASKPKTAQALDLQKLLSETTEPGLQGAPLGAIGPSVFKLSGERSVNPSLHGSYSHILHGEPVGAIDPIPREFLFRDLESKAMKELGRPLSDYNYRTSVGTPSQLIDDKLLRSLEELGYLK
jgi:hypothetical protein